MSRARRPPGGPAPLAPPTGAIWPRRPPGPPSPWAGNSARGGSRGRVYLGALRNLETGGVFTDRGPPPGCRSGVRLHLGLLGRRNRQRRRRRRRGGPTGPRCDLRRLHAHQLVRLHTRRDERRGHGHLRRRIRPPRARPVGAPLWRAGRRPGVRQRRGLARGRAGHGELQPACGLRGHDAHEPRGHAPDLRRRIPAEARPRRPHQVGPADRRGGLRRRRRGGGGSA